MTTYSIMRYPLRSTRKDKELFEEVDTEDTQALGDLVNALRRVGAGKWWYYFEKAGAETSRPVIYDATTRSSSELSESPIVSAIWEILAG